MGAGGEKTFDKKGMMVVLYAPGNGLRNTMPRVVICSLSHPMMNELVGNAKFSEVRR